MRDFFGPTMKPVVVFIAFRIVQYSVFDLGPDQTEDRTGPAHFGSVLGPGFSISRFLVWF